MANQDIPIKRRAFLKTLGTLSLTIGAPGFVSASSALADKGAKTESSILLPGSYPELDSQRLRSTGNWPEELRGTFYRNGPALFERSGYRHTHWFDGDGMIQKFQIDGNVVRHSSRYIRTNKFKAEASAERFLYDGVLTSVPDSVPLANNDTANTASISVREIGGSLYALWEAGSAYELDAESLDTLGIKTWSEELQHMPFSAHPLEDLDGSWWNIGSWIFGEKAKLLVYHLDSRGRMKTYKMLNLEQKGYIHAFAMSQGYLVVLNSACLYQGSPYFVDGFNFDTQGKSQILLIDKNTLEVANTIDIPANFAFHFGTAQEQKGTLSITMAEYTNADVMLKGMRHGSASFGRASYPSILVTYEINLADSTWTKISSGVELEFPQYFLDQPYADQMLYGIGASNGLYTGLSNSLVAASPTTGSTQRYHYSRHTISEEPLVIRDRGNRKYIIQPWVNLHEHRSGISLFRPNAIEAGPIATASLDRQLPLGFHGSFVRS